MNFLVLKYNKFNDYLEGINSENLGFYFSFLLHLFILVSIIGLPNIFEKKSIMIPTIIPIEIINISDVTSIPDENKDKVKTPDAKRIKVKQKKFNSSDNQEIKKIEVKDKPELKETQIEKKIILKEDVVIKEKKILIKKLKKKEVQINENNFESLPTKEMKPKLKPKPNISEKKINKKSDISISAKPKPKPEKDFNIASMLKDLRNENSTKEIESENEEENKEILKETKEEAIDEAAQLSISEIDLVLQQVRGCFIIGTGVNRDLISEDMFVNISAKIRENRRVIEPSIRSIDTNISKSNPVYAPITESAMKVLLNPECIPLKLPEDKYDLWKDLTLKFDYGVISGNKK